MKDKELILGTHIHSDINTMEETLDTLNPNINAVQFFVDPSNDYKKYKDVKAKLKDKNINAYIHSSYRINIAKEWDDSSWWVKYIIYEIKTAHILGAKGLVIHTGNKLDLNEKIALNNMYSFLLHVNNQTQNESNVKIIIETPAGQGTELLYEFNDLIDFMTKLKDNDRFGLCIDTCHIFAAGNDIRNKEIFGNILSTVNSRLGKNKLMLIHLNDSKDDLGEKKDRHDNLGYGFIGRIGLKHIIKKIKALNIPIILETPMIHHESEIKWIKDL